MTDEQKIVLVKALCDEDDSEVISVFLLKAAKVVCRLADPYSTSDEETILEEYGDVQCDLAAYYINKRGWDFETSHSENGVNRVYESGDVPTSVIQRIVPKAGVCE